MDTSVTVSVLMPVYNAARYLRAALDSILAQSLRDFELIAVDDGSTDSSKAMLEECRARDSRVRIISRGNTGIVGALNDGLATATGEFIARMDSDDIARPQRFARQVEYLRNHPDCVAVGSRVIMMDSDGAPIGDMPGIVSSHQEIDAALMIAGWPMVHPTVMIRRQAIERVGGYRPGTFPNEDHDLFLRLAEIGKLANLDEPLLLYRRHFQSVVYTQNDNSRPIRRQIIEAAQQRRGLAGGAPIPPAGPPWPIWQQRAEWAWTALKAGYPTTARKHALGVLRQRPLSKSSWRVMYCALRGR